METMTKRTKTIKKYTEMLQTDKKMKLGILRALALVLLVLPQSIQAGANGALEQAPFELQDYGDQGVDENNGYTSPAASITGSPVGTVTYTITGTDAPLFSINSSNGVVTMVARDYESPLDDDGNNLYSATVTATDSDSNTSEVPFDLVVFNDCSGSDTPEMFKLSAPDALGDTTGSNDARLRITLLGGGGVPLENVAVMFVRTSGTATITSPSGTTGATGIYESDVTASSIGTSLFTAMYDSSGDGTPDTTVTLGSPTPIQFAGDISDFNTDGMVGIGTEDPDASTVLEVAGTEKGVLIPRVSLTGITDQTTIASPAVSLLVYNTSSVGGLEVGFVFWDGSEWKSVCAR